MIVTTSGGAHECVSAELQGDGVHLLDAEGKIILIITDPKDIKGVQGGEIANNELPTEITADDVLNALLGVAR